MANNTKFETIPAIRVSAAPTRVVIFESTKMSCELLAHALEESGYGLTVVSASPMVPGGEEAGLNGADVAVISSSLQGGSTSGFTLLRKLVKAHSSLRCVMLLDTDERELVVEAFRSGAVGVCEREQSYEILCKCIQTVHGGQVWANSQQLTHVLAAFSAGVPNRIKDAKGKILLTRREGEIVSLVAEGLKNREIAESLKLSEHTVKNHLFRIFERLGISSRAELILYLVGQRG